MEDTELDLIDVYELSDIYAFIGGHEIGSHEYDDDGNPIVKN
jgi:hypothetical protein